MAGAVTNIQPVCTSTAVSSFRNLYAQLPSRRDARLVHCTLAHTKPGSPLHLSQFKGYSLTLRNKRLGVCRAVYEPFPFKEGEYYRVRLDHIVQTGVHGRFDQGEVILKRDAGDNIMKVVVFGDTLTALMHATAHESSPRPLSLDLLWTILQRGQEVGRHCNVNWNLSHVAIVGLKNNIYLGRLFFGDSVSGLTVWDCDARPSDALWLACKARCPIFVKRSVWEEACSLPLPGISPQEAAIIGRFMDVMQQATGRPAAQGDLDTSPAALSTTIRDSDPEAIKLLKMEMRVALREEDYAAAARLRDHPFMALHSAILRCEARGDTAMARQLRAQLDDAIAEQQFSHPEQQEH